MTIHAIHENLEAPRTPEAAPLLRVEELHHAFGDRPVLTGLNFGVKQGEVFGLLGPNGSGKSTALALIAGLRPLQSGEVTFRGFAPGDRHFRAQFGMIFQSPALDLTLSARQNLGLAARLHALPTSTAQQRIQEGLEQSGLLDRADDRVGTFSGGMRRRLDIARGLIHRPRLLLMDEPTAGLDESAFRGTWEHLEALREALELTIVVATHRPEEAERCHRLAVIHEGQAAFIDSPVGLKQQVSTDVIVLVAADPVALAADITERFQTPCHIDGGAVLVECERGHELVPRIVEAHPEGLLRSVSLRHPTLADVFLKITGSRLTEDSRSDKP